MESGIMDREFEIATDKIKWPPPSDYEVIYTNCTDKIKSHSYRWLSGDEYEEVAKEHPKWRGIRIVKCIKCGKVNGTM